MGTNLSVILSMDQYYKPQIILSGLFLICCIIPLLGCRQKEHKLNEYELIDKYATKETKNLFASLFSLQSKKILFGHQDALAYGVNWRYENGRSDVKDVTGDYPAVMGWDIGQLEHGSENNIDGVPFELMRQFIIESAQNGSINTISWHLDNPLTGGNSWDTTSVVKDILPSGHLHDKFIGWLDRVADFLKTLKFEDGSFVPILFRPYHELNGNWFWWCKPFCTQQEYTDLWRFTVHYLKDKKNIHHLIYIYNTNNFKNEEDFIARYPGDEYIDMLSFDTYQFTDPNNTTPDALEHANTKFKNHLKSNLDILQYQAKKRKKLMSLAETGFETIPFSNWWTEVLYETIHQYDISYVLIWRNQGLLGDKMHYYAPYEGHHSSADFQKMFENTKMALQQTTKSLDVYKRR